MDNRLLAVILMILWLFIKVKCDYLVLPNNFRLQFFRIHQINPITSIKHIDIR